jgi:hypothetical protein
LPGLASLQFNRIVGAGDDHLVATVARQGAPPRLIGHAACGVRRAASTERRRTCAPTYKNRLDLYQLASSRQELACSRER